MKILLAYKDICTYFRISVISHSWYQWNIF